MPRRVTRKMMKEDEFVSFFDEFAHWFNANWRLVAAGLGVVVVVVLVWWGASAWSGSRGEEASFLLHRAEKALEGDGTTPGSVDAAEPLLREVVDRYGRTHQADAARSTFLGTDPVGPVGPFEVGTDELLDLHHVVLSAGDLQIVQGNLGQSLYRLVGNPDAHPFVVAVGLRQFIQFRRRHLHAFVFE